MIEIELALPSRRATRRLGAAMAALLRAGDVVWLEGELGAGKTFLARALLRGLGVPERVPVTSPTFALVHEHEGVVPIRHLDLYRLRSADELGELGIEEGIEDRVTVVEWGRRLAPALALAADGVEVTLLHASESARVARLRALDARGEAVLEALAQDARIGRLRASP